MAKTVDPAKHAPPDDVEEPMDAETSDPEDLEDAAGDEADVEEEEEDLSLPVDPTAREEGDERALTTTSAGAVAVRTGSGGIYVPAFLMRNPITRWLAEAYVELRKVTWPEPREAWNMSIVVVVVSVIMAGLLAAADYGLGHLLSYFVSLGLGH